MTRVGTSTWPASAKSVLSMRSCHGKAVAEAVQEVPARKKGPMMPTDLPWLDLRFDVSSPTTGWSAFLGQNGCLPNGLLILSGLMTNSKVILLPREVLPVDVWLRRQKTPVRRSFYRQGERLDLFLTDGCWSAILLLWYWGLRGSVGSGMLRWKNVLTWCWLDSMGSFIPKNTWATPATCSCGGLPFAIPFRQTCRRLTMSFNLHNKVQRCFWSTTGQLRTHDWKGTL